MQLASVATCATACRCRSVTTRYARAAGSLGAQDRQTSGGGARSKARLMWGCSRRHPERQLPADMPDEVQSQWREWTAHYRRPHGLGTRQSAVAVEAGCACHAVLWQLLQGKWRCRAHIAAALVLMRATRLSPGRTQAAAEPTARPTAAAVSTDSNENGRICVGGLGPDAGSVWRRPERQRPDARHQSRTPRAPDAVRSQ